MTQSQVHVMSPFPDARHLYLLVAGMLVGVLLGPAVFGRIAPRAYANLFVGGQEAAAQLKNEQEDIKNQLHQSIKALSAASPAATQEYIAKKLAGLKPKQRVVEEARIAKRREIVGWLTALILAMGVVMALEALLAPDPAARENADAAVNSNAEVTSDLSTAGDEAISTGSAPAQASLEQASFAADTSTPAADVSPVEPDPTHTFPADIAAPPGPVAPTMASTAQRLPIPPFVPRLVTIRYALLACWIALVIAQPAILGNLPILFTLLVIAVALGVGLVPLGRRRPAGKST